MAALAGDDAETSIVHRVAYIFSPSDDEEDGAGGDGVTAAANDTSPTSRRGRKHRDEAPATTPAKKRRTAKGRSSLATTQMHDDGRGGQDADGDDDALAAFPPLLQGRETPEAVARRRQLFTSLWSQLDDRIQAVLRRSNEATLRAVMDFVEKPIASKLPAAFVILGPAATTDMLLFRQLAASLTESEKSNSTSSGGGRCVRRMVRLRAAEAPNLRAALKTIVQVATTAAVASGGDGDEDDVVAHNGRKYLAYDLEAVYAAINSSPGGDASSSRIVIAFEDSEAFDAALLADLLSFLHSWLDRIPFVLLFGVATSVDLFQARLPKQAAHRLAAAQFDVAPSSAVLDRLVRRAVAAADVPLRLGPSLLRSLAERQDEQVTGVSVFVNSLKYAYMCYFYANPLSIFLQNGDDDGDAAEALLQNNPDYLAAIRQLPSFRRHVEALMADAAFDTVRQLLDSEDGTLLRQAVAEQLRHQRRWTTRLARALQLAAASGVFAGQSFTELYITALEARRGSSSEDAFTLDDDTSLATTLTSAIRRMSAAELVALARRLAAAVQAGDADLALEAPENIKEKHVDDEDDEDDDEDVNWKTLASTLTTIADEVEDLQTKLESSHASRAKSRSAALQIGGASGKTVGGGGGGPTQLRSKYTSQSKVLRTTVVAQKVQLSRDSAALTEEDQAFTERVDAVVQAVVDVVDVEPASSSSCELWLQEIWLYDARTPYRDVFIPRPGLVVERALARPHDYLACECCDSRKHDDGGGRAAAAAGGSIRPTLPATAILYQLYLEAGPLINVADLWEAFQTAVSDSGNNENNGAGGEEQKEDEDEDAQERRHLVQFYQGLSEMKTLGYIKATRRKVDHVAKIKWL